MKRNQSKKNISQMFIPYLAGAALLWPVLALPAANAAFCSEKFKSISRFFSGRSEKKDKDNAISRLRDYVLPSNNQTVFKRINREKESRKDIQSLNVEELTAEQLFTFLLPKHISWMTNTQQRDILEKFQYFDQLFTGGYFGNIGGIIIADYVSKLNQRTEEILKKERIADHADEVKHNVELISTAINHLNHAQIISALNGNIKNPERIRDLIGKLSGKKVFLFRVFLFDNMYIPINVAQDVMEVLYKMMTNDALMKHFTLLQANQKRDKLASIFEGIGSLGTGTSPDTFHKSAKDRSLKATLEYHIPKGNLDSILTRFSVDVLNTLSPNTFSLGRVFSKLNPGQIHGLSYDIVDKLSGWIFTYSKAVHINPEYLAKKIQSGVLLDTTIEVLEENLKEADKYEDVARFMDYDHYWKIKHAAEIPIVFPENTRQAYKVLGIDEGVSDEAVREAYLGLIKKWHPDTNHHPEAIKNTQSVNEAYNILQRSRKD